jgi:predicted nucleotidyltransferase
LQKINTLYKLPDMNNTPKIALIEKYLENEPTILFGYLFGSHAQGMSGPLSDIDIAVYLQNESDHFTLRLKFIEHIDNLLKDVSCDLVVLNPAPLLLQFEAIRNGIVLKENRVERMDFETQVTRDYLDTEYLRNVHIAALKKKVQGKHLHG